MLNQINRFVFESSIDCSPGVRKGSGRASRLRAFTVLEVIGVLAVIAILAAAVLPNVIRRIDQAALDREKSDLSNIADRFVQAILANKIIPATNNAPAAIATYSDMAASQISINPRGFRRVIMADPSLSINGSGLGISGYSQGGGGSPTPPISPRFLILSSIAKLSPTNINPANFSTIWNTTNGGTVTGWTGKPDDLCIQRVDLGAMFHKVVLGNLDPLNDGFYAFENNMAAYVPHGGVQFTAYVLDGTTVNLFQQGTSDPDNLQVRVIVRQDESYVYQNNRWARSLSSDQLTQTLEPQSFAWWVQKFLEPSAPPDPKFSATQQAVIDEMYTFMSSYVLWAMGDTNHIPSIPPFQGTGASSAPQFPYYSVLPDSLTRLGHFTFNLTH